MTPLELVEKKVVAEFKTILVVFQCSACVSCLIVDPDRSL